MTLVLLLALAGAIGFFFYFHRPAPCTVEAEFYDDNGEVVEKAAFYAKNEFEAMDRCHEIKNEIKASGYHITFRDYPLEGE